MIVGIGCVVLASISCGMMPVFTQYALQSGMSPQNVVFFRFFFTFIIAGILCLVKKVPLRVTKRQLGHLAFFGLLGFGLMGLFLALSYSYLPGGVATMMLFSYPLFVNLILVCVFREKISRMQWFSLILILAGLFCMADFKGGLSVIGTVFAVLSGAAYAIYVVANRKSAIAELPPLTVIFYIGFFCSIFFGIQNLASRTFDLPGSISVLGSLVAVGGISTVFALTMFTTGIRLLGVPRASVVNMLEPITSVVAGAIVYQEQLSASCLAGCILIVSSVFIVTLDKQGQPKRV